ncbi:MAG: nitroreductase family protein [Thermoplasmatales archaeon]|nr:nitroreductase family protein [Thermoplasmatales archaeon]
MMKNNLYRKSLAVTIIIIFFSLSINPVIVTSMSNEYPLPHPMPIDMTLLDAIFRRMSVRGFTDQNVTDDDLSTVLWAAYGYRDDGNRTVSGIDGVYASVIYVLKENAVYRYDPLNHSLVFYKDGDYRYIGQYEAPIQLGLVWDKNKSGNENYSGAEMGAIGQNIQFMANALNLGTVVTGEVPSPIDEIGLPSNEVGKIVMPLGYPNFSYDFTHRPMWLSLLPRIKEPGASLQTVLEERSETTSFAGNLTRSEVSQVLWASYGYSYLLDKSDAPNNPIKRHRTVPSAHGYYPLRMYAVTKSGIYRYIHGIFSCDRWGLPIVSFMLKIRNGDKREEIAQASQPFVVSAPFLIISVLDIRRTNQWDDLSAEKFRWIWYYEAGASAHNVLLQAKAWNLTASIALITDTESVRSLLRLNDNFLPLFIVPIGK